jgi:hypothetical protein
MNYSSKLPHTHTNARVLSGLFLVDFFILSSFKQTLEPYLAIVLSTIFDAFYSSPFTVLENMHGKQLKVCS